MSLKNMLKVMSRLLPDSLYIRLAFFMKMKKFPNLKNPKTCNEKIQWLKLNDRKPEYTRMVDKLEAKKYVTEKIGAKYVIPTLGVWDQFGDIDFNNLPEQFVLKCTHDSGGVIICRNKGTFDKDAAKKKIERSLHNNYYWQGREWPYKDVKPRIIAEKYMVNSCTEDLKDYKYYCFNGIPEIVLVVSDREKGCAKADYFDMHFTKLNFTWGFPNSNTQIQKPKNFELMKTLAEKLSVDIPFLRVDFYEVDDSVYFGELTFFDGSGTQKIIPEEWDEIIGKKITLPN